MEIVIVDREFEAPVTPEAVLADDDDARWCFDQYRTNPSFHLLALDGIRLCCVFRAPDAEAVRQVARTLEMSPPKQAWAASLEGWNGDLADLRTRAGEAERGGSLALVERSFPAPVDFPAFQALEDAGSWCLDLNGVRFLGTFFARDRRRMLCLYQAPDSEAVKRTNSRLELPFDRVWPARVVAAD